MTACSKPQQSLPSAQSTCLITGVVGFIGSNLLETMLQLGRDSGANLII